MRGDRGQGIVEFALVIPIVLTLFVGMIELSLAFNSRNTVFFAARDASMLAAEGGSSAGTDCVVLDRIEADVVSPARDVRTQSVSIYWSDKNGQMIGTNQNIYARTGSMTCTYGNGTSIMVPYTLTTGNYLEANRCDVLAGCGGTHTTPDNIGVSITYVHTWVTSFVKFAASSATFNLSSATRIEPQK